MGARSVIVLGGGVAGLATALLLARDGHAVTVVERDDLDVGEPLAAPEWSRRGIPHFLQPHAFIPRGRSEMMRLLPDVYDDLLDAGAEPVDLCRRLSADDRRPGDDELQYLGARRPLIEWALRRAASVQPGIALRPRRKVTGLEITAGRVTAVFLDDGRLETDLVVDALGRRTPTIEWLAAGAVDAPEVTTTDCGVVYYSRYYCLRPGAHLPDGPWPLSPRGDLGYLGYSTFPGDNGTFAGLLAVPNGVPEWRSFRDPLVFEAAVATIPALASWADPQLVEPVTDVLPMAGLRNSIRDAAGAVAAGVLPVGDALSHSDPVLAHGLAFALIGAGELAAALRAGDPPEAGAAYLGTMLPALRERYDLASALDEQRHRMWIGESVDLTRPDGDYALFTMIAGAVAASADPEILRTYMRRITLLDSVAVLDQDVEMQRRIERVFAQVMASPRPPSGPTRAEMLSLVSAHG